MIAEMAIVRIGPAAGTSGCPLVSECIGQGTIHPASNFKKQWSYASTMRSTLTMVLRTTNLHVTSSNIHKQNLPAVSCSSIDRMEVQLHII
jgi:hypothetical protein